MPASATSLVLCELVLVASCLRSAALLHSAGGFPYASKGILFVGLAASLGAMRFAGAPVGRAHDLWSRMAATVGIPLIGAQYLALEGWDLPQPTTMRVFVVAALLEAVLQRGLRKPVETLLGAGTMASMALFGRTDYFGRVGAALSVAAVVVGPSQNKKTLMFWNIDLFHVLLAASMTAVRLDLLRSRSVLGAL